MTNVTLAVDVFGVTCHYHGDLTGTAGEYQETTDALIRDGTVTKSSDSPFMCLASGGFAGTYTMTPTDLEATIRRSSDERPVGFLPAGRSRVCPAAECAPSSVSCLTDRTALLLQHTRDLCPIAGRRFA